MTAALVRIPYLVPERDDHPIRLGVAVDVEEKSVSGGEVEGLDLVLLIQQVTYESRHFEALIRCRVDERSVEQPIIRLPEQTLRNVVLGTAAFVRIEEDLGLVAERESRPQGAVF